MNVGIGSITHFGMSSLHGNPNRRQFASDNYAGICPEVWDALAAANSGHAPGYGEDAWTARASNLLREIFETDCEVFFVFNGTAANSLALSSLCRSYHSILCHQTAHVETDECGAPEFFSNGTKVLLLPGANGKIERQSIERMVKKRRDIHYPKPRAVSITQSTELGTVYSEAEIQDIGVTAKAHGLHLHMDGARFSNAVSSLQIAPRRITWEAGVDVLCFGATKNGAPVGEAVVFFNRELAAEFDYRCKQAGQLASKMRFLTASWIGLLEDGAWLRHASHANAMAQLMEENLRAMGVEILFPREANAVFAQLAPAAIDAMHARGWKFYSFIGEGGCRLMCSWDTTPQDVESFALDLKNALQRVLR
jgi:threonine aldolase